MGSLGSAWNIDELMSQRDTCSHNHPGCDEVATSFPQALVIIKYDSVCGPKERALVNQTICQFKFKPSPIDSFGSWNPPKPRGESVTVTYIPHFHDVSILGSAPFCMNVSSIINRNSVLRVSHWDVIPAGSHMKMTLWLLWWNAKER